MNFQTLMTMTTMTMTMRVENCDVRTVLHSCNVIKCTSWHEWILFYKSIISVSFYFFSEEGSGLAGGMQRNPELMQVNPVPELMIVNWIGMDWLDWIVLGWICLDLFGLHEAGLDLTGLDKVGRYRRSRRASRALPARLPRRWLGRRLRRGRTCLSVSPAVSFRWILLPIVSKLGFI